MKNTSVDNSATLYELNKNDFVVEWYGPDTDGNWYRVYKSGWVEQGGNQTLNTSSPLGITINLLKEYKDDSYTVLGNGYGANGADGFISFQQLTTTSFLWRCCDFNGNAYNRPGKWVAMGQGA